MNTYYSCEKNVQILVALLKAHGIKKIITSPGTTNISFVASVQSDTYFEVFSSVDERSAAYMACGFAAESGEAVALSCTGATASRNYIPGLTEAYYRKLPILAITSTQPIGRIGHNINQVIDRTNLLNDIAKMSVLLPVIHDSEDEWECEIKVNKALLELYHRGGGPVHINLTTSHGIDFSEKKLPQVRAIKRIEKGQEFPVLPVDKRVGIFVGAHRRWSQRLTDAVDVFCEKYNTVVLCDQTSNYKGKYGVFFTSLILQKNYSAQCLDFDIIIHIGDVSASGLRKIKEVWRVNPDGEIRDTFRKLSYVFEMEEVTFFEFYNNLIEHTGEVKLFAECEQEYCCLISLLKEKSDVMPYSNIWIALQTYSRLPKLCVIHFGILNSLRSWNIFKVSNDVLGFSNTGGFGIDGGVSSLIGAALNDRAKLFFGVVGDLAFFYDMNSLGNRHVGNNIRLLIINNGMGSEFKNGLSLPMRSGIEDDADQFIAAAGHYGKKSTQLVKHYAEDLGFQYLSASNKQEYMEKVDIFMNPDLSESSMIFEVFTDSNDETEALEIVRDMKSSATGTAKKMVKDLLGEKGINALKRIVKK